MNNWLNIKEVVNNGLCTGCGTCVGLCPCDAIEMAIDKKKGIYNPVINEERCNNCGICIKVCPGHEVDFPKLNEQVFGKQPEDILLGNYINCYTGYATDYDARYNSASGGLVTALLIYALEQGIIDGALVTKMNSEKPLEPQPFIARTKEEIIEAARSKYCPVPANIALKEIIRREGKYAVVGLPCHLHGIRKAEAINKKLKERIVLHLGIFCSHPMNFQGTKFILNKFGVHIKEIRNLAYRGHGWPGNMMIEYNDNKKMLIPHKEHSIYLSLGFFTPERCFYCCDQIADMSDISFGDAWIPELIEKDNIGTSAIIIRNAVGHLFIDNSITDKAINIEHLDYKTAKKMVTKKSIYQIIKNTNFLRKNLPVYKIKLTKPNLGDYLRTILLLLNGSISKRYMWFIITPLAKTERICTRTVGIALKLIGISK